MFDDLVINEKDCCDCEQCEPEPAPDPNANIKSSGSIMGNGSVQGTNTGSVPKPIKKILSNGGYSAGNPTTVPGPSNPPLPTAVILDFDLAKMFMLESFIKDTSLEAKYTKRIADMIEYAIMTQGCNVHDANDRAKMGEMILAEIFY